MVYLRVSTQSEAKALQIAQLLLEEKLAIDLNMTRINRRFEMVNSQ